MMENDPNDPMDPLRIQFSNPAEKESPELDVLVAEDEEHSIILFNDEVHTFDYVIECLQEICGHTPEQALQCTLLVHYKGKCPVQSGSWEELEVPCSKLLSRGLSAEIA